MTVPELCASAPSLMGLDKFRSCERVPSAKTMGIKHSKGGTQLAETHITGNADQGRVTPGALEFPAAARF